VHFHESTAIIARFESYHEQLFITTATAIYSLTEVKCVNSRNDSSINIVIGIIIIIIPK